MNKQKKINGGKLSMKKVASKRAKLLSVLCLATLVPFGVGMATLNANADTGFGIVAGAGVRMSNAGNAEETGIRFTAQMSKTEFETITAEQDLAVYFGIQLTANGKTNDVCYLVNDKDKIGAEDNEQEVDFGENDTFKYYASILYNEAELKATLATNADYNLNYDASKSDEENIEAFDETLLQRYLNQAYATELTAQAYYQIGETKTPVGDTTTRSIWGVASKAYIDNNTKYATLVEKYFNNTVTTDSSEILYETGSIDYEFAATDKVYYDTQLISITDGVMDTELYAGKVAEGDTMKLAVVAENGALKVLEVAVESNTKNIATQAFYDAAADKMYYTDENGVQQTIAGTAGASFSYVVDDTTSYALADYTSGSLVSNVNYKYADSALFNNSIDATDYSASSTSYGGLLYELKPEINYEGGSVVASIPYNAHTDVYTGVKTTIKIGEITYNFADTVITSQMIDDAAELDSVFNNADKNADSSTGNYVWRAAYITKYGTITKGVYMLANDIDCSENFTYDNSYWNFFEGVFDGRGHNISNLDVSGTEDKTGNGLFSATSIYSAIQNVGFINVKASYGSVFQGNQFDRVQSTSTVWSYYMADGTTDTVNGSAGLGSKYYRSQLVDESDTTTTIGELLKSDRRGAVGSYGQGGYFQNVYVQVDPTTQRLMGVISKNMANSTNTVRAYNMVIEYLPEKLFDSAEGANDGALPYGYDYTNGRYGVLFGGAYEYNTHSQKTEYEKDETYFDKNEDGSFKYITYFTPDTTVVNANVQTKGALYFNYITFYYGGRVNHSTKLYVVSPMGLVSSAQGSILGTNETATEDNPYAFVSLTSKLWNTNSVYTRLERYDNYDSAAVEGKTTNDHITSFKADNGAEENYWDISGGYLQWRNIPQTQE